MEGILTLWWNRQLDPAVAGRVGRAVWLAGPDVFHSFKRHGGNILRGSLMSRCAVGLVCLLLALVCVGQDEGAFDSLAKALREPERVKRLAISGGEGPEMK